MQGLRWRLNTRTGSPVLMLFYYSKCTWSKTTGYDHKMRSSPALPLTPSCKAWLWAPFLARIQWQSHLFCNFILSLGFLVVDFCDSTTRLIWRERPAYFSARMCSVCRFRGKVSWLSMTMEDTLWKKAPILKLGIGDSSWAGSKL